MLQTNQYEGNGDCGETRASKVFCPTCRGEGSRGEKVGMDDGQGIKICQSLSLNMNAQLEELLMNASRLGYAENLITQETVRIHFGKGCTYQQSSSNQELWQDMWTPMFTAALVTIVRRWRKSMCLSTDEWTKKMWYIHKMDMIQPLKGRTLSYARTWMNLEDTKLNKLVTKTQILWFHLKQSNS